ncbi:nickel-dependent hydrogenase large subunit [Beijerinckia indica]|uniref:Nickel-dependent hydrogenase large subunit n=1 Tax=Beijerinckia indica subsp. indica (strain ATCC 9039 / DSM 1715 / NCIMB 8712) TaxID=395963 RepID=B2IJ26_BEII9|nr:nickel-dependent hydrogenase large subunit [Beijerinckia indica]ACB94789.1 nickel-dependent hydrogenase large subunit [Beijerinckia indica subsp. indica ATCC 9039]
MSEAATRLIVGPFNRVEGDLEVRLEMEDGVVTAAFVNATLFRGFERILEGRDPSDALVIAPRICGICSVSQSHAAALALAGVMGIAPARNGQIAANITLATENLADHLTHFHLFFMPDFARGPYRDRPWFDRAEARFAALRGASVRPMMQTRALLLHVMGLIAGHWPHTLAIQPGGFSRGVDARDKIKLLAILSGVRAALEERLFGTALERVAALADPEELSAWRMHGPEGDFRLFLEIAADLHLETLGRAYDRFLCYGAYPGGGADGAPLYPSGLFAHGLEHPLDLEAIAEDHTYARMENRGLMHPPFMGSTSPDGADEQGYSWCKAPRLSNEPCETGALARQVMDGQPLVRALVARAGGNVFSRVIARLLEVARVLIQMETWTKALEPGAPWCVPAGTIGTGRAVGLTEAARGALGHWLRVENGRIAGYQIIAPTTWNFSPRDARGLPGPLERALIGAPVQSGETTPVSVQHIVRSFDPCMACTVH